jgi:hypothetical protein
MVGSGCSRIVRSWSDPTAPTGEGDMYEDEYGRTWRRVYFHGPHITGVSYGRLCSGHICPANGNPSPPPRPHPAPAPKPRRGRFFEHATARKPWESA